MATKVEPDEQAPEVAAEVPGWPGVKVQTPEEHDAQRRAEAEASA